MMAVEGHTERRTLVEVPLRRSSAPMRVAEFERQLPTDHEHDGGLQPIRENQCHQPSLTPFGRQS
jgi:hypothetical protein